MKDKYEYSTSETESNFESDEEIWERNWSESLK